MTTGKITFMAERPESSTVTVTFPDHYSIDGYVEEFKNFLLAIGFHPDTVKRELESE